MMTDGTTAAPAWIDALSAALAQHGRATLVVVAQVSGSVPRESGTAMVITARCDKRHRRRRTSRDSRRRDWRAKRCTASGPAHVDRSAFRSPRAWANAAGRRDGRVRDPRCAARAVARDTAGLRAHGAAFASVPDRIWRRRAASVWSSPRTMRAARWAMARSIRRRSHSRARVLARNVTARC
jgi:hypothetical protein